MGSQSDSTAQDVEAADSQLDFSPDVFSPQCSQPASADMLRESSIPPWLEQVILSVSVIQNVLEMFVSSTAAFDHPCIKV